ncbi:MAG TPA: transporter substrate-binding domain-containing protein [Terriglobales bacterium]|nr:transporter substrate-binding domain-containing protein [Terriglobales bacterium]
MKPAITAAGIRLAIFRPRIFRQTRTQSRRFRLIAAALIAAFCSLAATLPVVADAPAGLRLVTGPDYKPFTDPSLPMGGMQSEIVRAAFGKVGETVNITFQPWLRGYAETQRLAFDATFPYARSTERAKDFLYSDDIYVQVSRPYVLQDSTLTAVTTDDLAGKTLCSPQGYVVAAPIAQLLERRAIRLERPDSMDQCFKMLQLRRVDAVICVDVQAHATAQHVLGHQDMVKPLAAVIAITTNGLIVARQHPDAQRIIADFNRGLALLKASGEFDAIVKRQLDGYISSMTN